MGRADPRIAVRVWSWSEHVQIPEWPGRELQERGGWGFGQVQGLPIDAERLPPANIEAEMGVLGSVLLDNDSLHDVIPILKVEDFYRDTHQKIYRVIRDLYDLGKPVDLILLNEELVRRNLFDAVGGNETLVSLIDSVPHAAHAKYYADLVRQKAISRQLIESANEMLNDGYSNNFTAEELLQSAEKKIFAIAEEETTAETHDIKDVIVSAMDRIVAKGEGIVTTSGVQTGFIDLDEITAGFQGTQLIILAARPAMGKTAIALNICEHVICTLNKGVLFVSLEMGELELVDRLLSSRARVDGYKIKTGKGLGQQDLAQLGRAYNDLHEAPLYIDSTPARNSLQITANARRLKLRKDVGMIVVDYIQLVDADDPRDSRQEQIAKVSRRLKQIARELNIPVVALSQLNRAVENREDRRPRMADLRESGAIEQDADLVLLLHRPEYYDPNDQPGVAELIIAKNRSGGTDTVKLAFLKNLTRFENLAHTADPARRRVLGGRRSRGGQPRRGEPAVELIPQTTERRGHVPVKDELGRRADDPIGPQLHQHAVAGCQAAGGDQGRDAPAGLLVLAPDLAPGGVLRPLLRQVAGDGGRGRRPLLARVADHFEVEHPRRRPDPVHRVEQVRQRAGLPLGDQRGQRRDVADQAGCRVEDAAGLDLAEAVVLQRHARAGQIDDDVGDPQGRMQFKGTVGVDNLVVVDPPLPEVRLGEGGVLGRDPEGLAAILELVGQVDEVDDVDDVDPAFGHGHDQAAAAVAQVLDDDGRVLGLEGPLGIKVHPRYPEVAAPFLDLGDDVGRPHEDDVGTADGRRSSPRTGGRSPGGPCSPPFGGSQRPLRTGAPWTGSPGG